MQTLYDFGMEVQKIREAINSINIKAKAVGTSVYLACRFFS